MNKYYIDENIYNLYKNRQEKAFEELNNLSEKHYEIKTKLKIMQLDKEETKILKDELEILKIKIERKNIESSLLRELLHKININNDILKVKDIEYINIPIDDFKIMKILLSERFCNLNHKIGTNKVDEINFEAYGILKNLYYKYCDNK